MGRERAAALAPSGRISWQVLGWLFLLLAASCTNPETGEPERLPEAVERQLESITEDSDEELLQDALLFYENAALPSIALPQGFIEADRLQGECIASFGISVLEPESARESGVYYFEFGDEIDRISAIRRACETALLQLGVLLPPTETSFRELFAAYVEVHECLKENGFDTTNPPTVELFVQKPHSWTPWQAMIGRSSPILLLPGAADTPSLAEYANSLSKCPRP